MRYQILTKIEAEDNLALLLNAYQRKLSMIEQLVLPHESMAEYQALLRSATSPTPSQEADHVFNHSTPRFYYLQVLNNALTDLHKNVGWAIDALTKFFDQYDGDLQRYAIEHRLDCINDFGSEDESDWVETGTFDEEGEPEWQAVYKDDEQSLASYSFHVHLAQFFVGADVRGEKIGSSTPVDYAYFSTQVARATEFSPVKWLREFAGKDIPLYRENETGAMVPQSLGQEVENELNEDLKNQSIVSYFHQVLQAGQQAAATFASATTSEHYQALLKQLQGMRDVCFF